MSEELSAIAREIQQRRPFRTKGQEVVVSLLRTSDVLRRFVARVLEPYGVTPQQYNVLRILRGAGEDGCPTLSIGERMIEEAPGITRLIDRLEIKGLVRRQRCAEDRRQVLCWLTSEGRTLVDRIDEPMDAADDDAVGMLSSDEQTTLCELLDKIRAGHRP
jgi:DNA-binding MarR family transcriptional regulator